MGNGLMVNEKLLLLEIASGNEDAFKEVFNFYRPNLYTTVKRITGDPQVAEEILLDSFLKVWLKRELLPDLENFGGWLYTIAENLTYNAIKSLKRRKEHSARFALNIYADHFAPADEWLREKEYQQLLHKAIACLPKKQQQTYILIKEHGLKRNEVARVLGVSPETVKWNLDQAMRSLRAFFIRHIEIAGLICFIFV
jgi:RNA polymerase sigma factor (sigma-70 family)